MTLICTQFNPFDNARYFPIDRAWKILYYFGKARHVRCDYKTRKEQQMRLDKYLKVSRLIKRRTVAAEACDGGRVSINGRDAKPSATVKPGDTIEVRFGEKLLRVEVLSVDEKTRPSDAPAMYRELI